MRVLVKVFLASTSFLLVSNPAHFSHAQDQSRRASCQSPIRYRIGTLDPRFGVTREEFQRAVAEAGSVWGQKLFQHDPNGKLRINLVYDTRQELMQHVITVRARIFAGLKEVDAIKNRLAPLEKNYRILEAAYSDQLASYEKSQDSYNRKVKHWNGAGGTLEAELRSLADERQSLRKRQEELETKRQSLNQAGDTLDELVKKHNALLAVVNAQASALNAESGGIQFEEGSYVREGGNERIDIFEFEGRNGLLVILAHELGHALRIKHNANPSSIMSPLIHTDRLVLTEEDQDGLKAICAPA